MLKKENLPHQYGNWVNIFYLPMCIQMHPWHAIYDSSFFCFISSNSLLLSHLSRVIIFSCSFFFFSFYHLGHPTTSIFKGISFFFCISFDFSRALSLVPYIFQALYLWLTGSQWPNLTGFPLERGRRCLKVNSNRYYLCSVTLRPCYTPLLHSAPTKLSIWMGSGANLSGFECLFSLLTNKLNFIIFSSGKFISPCYCSRCCHPGLFSHRSAAPPPDTY